MYIGPNGGFNLSKALENYRQSAPKGSSLGKDAGNYAINQSLNNLSNIKILPDTTKRINEILEKLPVTNKLGGLNSGWDVATEIQSLYGLLSGNVVPVSMNVGIVNNAISQAVNGVFDAILGNDIDSARKVLRTARVTRLLNGPYKNLPFISREKTLAPVCMGLMSDSKWFISMEVPIIQGKKWVPDPPYNVGAVSTSGGISAIKKMLGMTNSSSSGSKVQSLPQYSGTPVNFGNGFIPASSFTYDILSTETEQMSASSGLGINIPVRYNEKHTLRVEVINDEYNTVFNYLEAYRDAVYPSYNTVLPYKLACTLIKIYVIDRQRRLLDLYNLIGIVSPDSISASGTARESWSKTSMEIAFDIVGEIGENQKFSI